LLFDMGDVHTAFGKKFLLPGLSVLFVSYISLVCFDLFTLFYLKRIKMRMDIYIYIYIYIYNFIDVVHMVHSCCCLCWPRRWPLS
jgi:hypothetical protein